MKYLVVGLEPWGGIVRRPDTTSGSQGFPTCLSGTFETVHEVSTVRFKGRHIVLLVASVKNPSGCRVLMMEKIPVERVVVITDDWDLPFGTLRLRAKGSDGGHNGLKNIQVVLGPTVYPRRGQRAWEGQYILITCWASGAARSRSAWTIA